MPLKRLLLVVALGLGIFLVCLLTLSAPVWPVYAGPPAAGINDAPVVGLAQTLFDGALGTTPNQQGEFVFISFLNESTQTPAPGYTTLDTTANMADYAGYTHGPPLHSAPVLDAGAGYALRFSARVISESHISPDRAGFNIVAISDTPTRSLELAFWEDEIWAQGTTPVFFTHAEGVAFDTTASMVDYELIILGTTYSLLADNTEILSGSLRDYTGFSGPIDPYGTPNLLFFGDDTTSAQAAIELANIEVVNNLPLPDRSTTFNADLILDGIRALDVDAGSKDVVVTMMVTSGVLTAATGAPGGLTGAEISGNGTALLVLNGSIGQINHTLVASRGLVYRSLPAFTGLDPLAITIDDQGHSGTGSGKKRSTAFNIIVAAFPCYATPNGGATLYSSADAHAVQQAVDDPASTTSGEVRVAGTCAGVETRSGLAQTVYINKPLALRGGYTVTNWLLSDPVANPTVLDAQGDGRVIFITDTVETSIENLMVTRGTITGNGLCSVITANCGGGILATGPLTLSNVIVFSNSAHRGGGGIAALTSTTISNSRVEQNVSTGAGGGGGLYAEGPVSLAGTLFDGNTSTLSGGAVQAQNHALTVSNSSFIRNQSLVNVGGAIRLSFGTTVSGPLVISNSTFLSNTAGVSATDFSIVHGGAVYAFNAHVTAANSHFENNRCLTAGCDGGGVYVFGNPSFVIPVLRLSNTAIISNSGGRNGGGVFNSGQAFLTGGRFERNQITGGTHAFSEGGGWPLQRRRSHYWNPLHR